MRADQGKKYIRDLFNQLNEAMNDWDKAGFTSNDLKLFQDKLEDFYSKNNMNVAHKDRFTWQKEMTQEQADELFDLAESMAQDDYIYLETYQDMLNMDYEDIGTQSTYDKINLEAFSKISEQYPDSVQNLEDYVNFIDRMNNYKNNAMLSSILSSDQVAELYSLGSWQDLTDEQIETIIYTELELTTKGQTGDVLYNAVLEAIDLYDPSRYQF